MTRVVGTEPHRDRPRPDVAPRLAPRQDGRRAPTTRPRSRDLLARRRRRARLRPRGPGRGAGAGRRRCPRRQSRPRPCAVQPEPDLAGTVDDYGLLVEARSGFCTQLAGHRPGPIFVDVRAAGLGSRLPAHHLGAGAAPPSGADRRGRVGRDLALRRDARHPRLHDRSVRAGGAATSRATGSRDRPSPTSCTAAPTASSSRCGSAARACTPALLEVLGDEPSAKGYYADQVTGALDRPGPSVADPVHRPAPGRLDRAAAGRRRRLRAGLRSRARRWPIRTWPRSASPSPRTDDDHHDVVVGSPIVGAVRSTDGRGLRRGPSPTQASSVDPVRWRGSGSRTSRRSSPGPSVPRCWPTSAPT